MPSRKNYPWLIGGAADLGASTKTPLKFESAGEFEPGEYAGRNLHFGIREHAMGAVLNGLALDGLRAFGSSFLIFSDYMRPPMRLAAMMGLPVIYVFTHDSIGLGEDGPTHQPVEQLIGLRAVPDLIMFRPADANEVVEAWRVVVGLEERAGLPRAEPPAAADARPQPLRRGVGRGARRLCFGGSAERPARGDPDRHGQRSRAVRGGGRKLLQDSILRRASSACRRGSCSTGRTKVIGKACCRRPSRRASRSRPASPRGWERYAGADGAMLGMDHFGASAPIKDLLNAFGFTADHVVAAAKAQIAKWKQP